MKFPTINHYLTGVAIPVFSLYRNDNCGVGEFIDLIPFGKWCREVGIDLIQILPVNDSGYLSSPYSALSAYALHPLYINLESVPECSSFTGDITKMKESYGSLSKVRYREVLDRKLAILKKAYAKAYSSIIEDKKLKKWIKQNDWVTEYAVFKTLRAENGYDCWVNWPEYTDPSLEDIKKLWNEKEDTLFWAWVQYHLDMQLSKASKELDAMGVAIKGDIPILMDAESVDVWAHREYFKLEKRAGAPPDMFSAGGQNWGFPVYDWERLEKEDYSWWRRRLDIASKYYHAYRIDHVLGFFRIWENPAGNDSGSMGWFSPSRYIYKQELIDWGFSEGRIRWMSVPHIHGSEIRVGLGDEAQTAIEHAFNQLDNEDMYVFRENITSEADIKIIPLSDHTKNTLLAWFKDRALIDLGGGVYSPKWAYQDTRSFQSLDDGEKYQFSELVRQRENEAEAIWEENGRKLLSFMKSETDMLVCAEDLGAIPHCVPKVLSELNILGLRIIRWARKYSEPGEPFYHISEYPYLTVCTPAVHDTSTLRGWWEEEEDKQGIWHALGLEGQAPQQLTGEGAEAIIGAILGTTSLIAVFQIQDLFAVENELWKTTAAGERVNVPGTFSDNNWAYRMVVPIEKLHNYDSLNKKLQHLIGIRKKQKASLDT